MTAFQAHSRGFMIGFVVCVGLVVAVSLDLTGSFEEGRVARSLATERARSDAHLASALEWQAIAEGEVSDRVRDALDEVAQRLNDDLEAAVATPGLRGKADAYLAAVRQEFALVEAGEIAQARQLDQTDVDPHFDELMDMMSESIADSEAAATVAHTTSRLMTAAIVLAAVLVVSALVAYVDGLHRQQRLLLEADAQRKTEFVALASHELRTPLTAIVGFSELLVGGAGLSETEREFAAHVLEEGHRLTRITSDLLNLARIDAGQAQFDVADVDFRRVLDVVLRSQVSSRHSFDAQLDGIPVVTGNQEKLVEILGNLVENAVKYSPNGGRVAIRWDMVGGDQVRVLVTDEGLGVPEAEVARLFTRFHRIEGADRANIRSTGLGLYIVRELVTAMGGEVGAESVLGQGSTFWFTLPSRAALVRAA